MAKTTCRVAGVARLAATAESAPQYAELTDLESFFRLVDAAGFLTCHANIRSDLEKDAPRGCTCKLHMCLHSLNN
jgi:hypothetical protein